MCFIYVFSIYFVANKGDCDTCVNKMSMMYCVAFLTKYRKNLSIPVEWVQGLTRETVYNDGIDIEKNYTIFYAPEKSVHNLMDPCFAAAQISNAAAFDKDNTVGYFEARISETFSK